MQSTLSKHHQETYEELFRHPISHKLEWQRLVAMLKELGELREETNGKYKFDLNGNSLSFDCRGKEMEIVEIMRLRHFLENSHKSTISSPLESNVLLVLDHAGAHLYNMSEPSNRIHLEPYDPKGHDQQVHNPKGDSGGKQGAHRKIFHENLAAKLSVFDRILVMSDGHGASSEIDRFVAELNEVHPELASRIIQDGSMDIHHSSEAQLLNKARELFLLEISPK